MSWLQKISEIIEGIWYPHRAFAEWADRKRRTTQRAHIDKQNLRKDFQFTPEKLTQLSRTILTEIRAALSARKSVGAPEVSLPHSWQENRLLLDFSELTDVKDLKGDHCFSLHCYHSKVKISNATIYNLNAGHAPNLALHNCEIGHLVLDTAEHVEINRCEIGCLTFHNSRAGKSLLVKQSTIHYVRAGKIDPNSNGTEEYRFEKVTFLNSIDQSSLYKGSQGFRNLRLYLEAIGNSFAASQMHVAELRASRPHEEPVNKLISWAYDTFSEYGFKPWKSLTWLAGLIIFSTFLIYFNSGAVLGMDREIYVGWRSVFTTVENGMRAKSLYLAFQPLINPLGIFGPRQFVIASNGWIHTWLIFESIFALGLAMMTIFGIRKRFKLH